MPVFLCRWQNGDFSVVKAVNKEQAIEFLDEVANAESCPVTAIKDFMAHFRLDDEGEFVLESFGEATEDHVMRVGYPVLNEAFLDDANYKDINTTEERQKNIHEAVNQEKSRLWPKDETPKNKKHEPKTLLGSRIKATTDAPTRMIDRNVERQANETLKTFKGKGKAN